MAQLVKTVNGLAIASVKTVNGLAIASVSTINGLDNTTAGGGITAINGLDTYMSITASDTITLDCSGATEGALMLAGIGIRGDLSISTVPSGWTLQESPDAYRDDGGAGAAFGLVYKKVAAATETSYDWVVSSSQDCAGAAIEIVGGVSVSSAATETDEDLGVITGTAGGRQIAWMMAKHGNGSGEVAALSNDVDYTEIYDLNETNHNLPLAVAWADLGAGSTNGTDHYDCTFVGANQLTIHMNVTNA